MLMVQFLYLITTKTKINPVFILETQ